jgi:hypothetical protein
VNAECGKLSQALSLLVRPTQKTRELVKMIEGRIFFTIIETAHDGALT